MIDKNLVTSLELSKRLAKLMEEKGLEVETVFCWLQCEELNEFILTLKKDADKLRQADGVRGDNGKLHEIYSAFSVAELGERLPAMVSKAMDPPFSRAERFYWLGTSKEWNTTKGKKWNVWYITQDKPGHTLEIFEGNEAEARGLMYEYLLKNKLI